MVFQRPPHLPFAGKLARDLRPDALTLADPARRGHHPLVRREGPRARRSGCAASRWTSPTARAFPGQTADAYERLLLDAMIGDPMLFIRTDEVDQAWTIVAPIQESFADWQPPLARYAAGSWGPRRPTG